MFVNFGIFSIIFVVRDLEILFEIKLVVRFLFFFREERFLLIVILVEFVFWKRFDGFEFRLESICFVFYELLWCFFEGYEK